MNFLQFRTTILLLIASSCAFANQSLGLNGSNASPLHQLGFKGQGVNIGLLSYNNTLTTHNAFRDANGVSHAFANNATNDGQGIVVSGHDTWVAGVAISRGDVSHPNDIGVAPASNLYNERVFTTNGNYDTAFFETALDDAITTHNCRVIYSGIQLDPSHGINPNGQSQYTLLYDYYANTKNVVFANPAGNKITGVTHNITVFGDSYNGITTGGLAVIDPCVWGYVGYSSNLGLTSDGRRKPDVVGPSQNQSMPDSSTAYSWYTWPWPDGATSFSTPHTAGVAALLLSYADTTADVNDNRNEVIRAVIVNATLPNINDNNNVPTTGALWNVARGYGRIDAFRAYQILSSSRVGSDSQTSAARGWNLSNVGGNTSAKKTHTYSVYVNANERLVVTLTWNRAVTRVNRFGTYVYSASTFYPVTLSVTDAAANTIISDANTADNLKKFDIRLPAAGYYTIKVYNPSSQSQLYALAFDKVSPITGDFDMNYNVDDLDLLTLVDSWLSTDAGLPADLAIPAGQIDFADYSIFAENWLLTNRAYFGHP